MLASMWHDVQELVRQYMSVIAAVNEQEIFAAISQLPTDKAPGPDGFTELFFQTCQQIIKKDVIAALNSFHSLRCADLNLLNTASIVLIPNKANKKGHRQLGGNS